MAQLVKCPALVAGLGHGLVVRGIKHCMGLCAGSVEPA